MKAKVAANKPIPKGDSAYALGKRAEYIDKDTSLAMHYYMQSITLGERTESAVKDLASLMHQEGNTQDACTLLKQYKQSFTDLKKAENLLKTLEGKIEPTGSSLLKCIKIAPVDHEDPREVRALFKDPSRIADIKVFTLERFAVVSFRTHSAARKTINTYDTCEMHSLEWVDQRGNVAGLVHSFKKEKKRPDPKTVMMLLGRSLFKEIFVN